MQMNRLFEIVYLLLNKKMTTAKELAEHFEVSKRTILRDIDTLTAAGIPIYTTQGKGGGISILDNYVLNKTTVSDEEQNQILFALQSMSLTQHTETAETLARLRSLFDKTETDWIEVDFSRWGNTQPDKEKFHMLKTAIMQKQALSMTYPNACGELTYRTVYPLKLVFKSRAWYLQAYCLLKKDYRVFKINRILSAEALPDSFHDKPVSAPPMETFGSAPPTPVRLTLKLISQAAYRVYDEFDGKDIVKNGDGTFTVTTTLPDDGWLYGYLLSFGAAAEVVAPQSVKERLLMEAEKIKKIYL